MLNLYGNFGAVTVIPVEMISVVRTVIVIIGVVIVVYVFCAAVTTFIICFFIINVYCFMLPFPFPSDYCQSCQ